MQVVLLHLFHLLERHHVHAVEDVGRGDQIELVGDPRESQVVVVVQLRPESADARGCDARPVEAVADLFDPLDARHPLRVRPPASALGLQVPDERPQRVA
jgi:hypothetical protein